LTSVGSNDAALISALTLVLSKFGTVGGQSPRSVIAGAAGTITCGRGIAHECRSDTWPGETTCGDAEEGSRHSPAINLLDIVPGRTPVSFVFSSDDRPLLRLGLRMQRRAVVWLVLPNQPNRTLARQSSTRFPSGRRFRFSGSEV